MKRELRERRDRAADRHDAALQLYPARAGSAFTLELNAVADELSAVADAADEPTADPVEIAKTYRWLGDALFDLARGVDVALLNRGASAYNRAEALLTADAPVERAKLEFSYANTLRGLSGGFDVAMLEVVATKYESAARAFRVHGLPDLARAIDEQLGTLEPALRIARKHAQFERVRGDLQTLSEGASGAKPVDVGRIRAEIERLRDVMGQGNADESLDDAAAAIRSLVEQYPERFDSKGAIQLAGLMQQIESAKEVVASSSVHQADAGSGGGSFKESAVTALLEHVLADEAAGKVPPERAVEVRDLLQQFRLLPENAHDLASASVRAELMRKLMTLATELGGAPVLERCTTPNGFPRRPGCVNPRGREVFPVR